MMIGLAVNSEKKDKNIELIKDMSIQDQEMLMKHIKYIMNYATRNMSMKIEKELFFESNDMNQIILCIKKLYLERNREYFERVELSCQLDKDDGRKELMKQQSELSIKEIQYLQESLEESRSEMCGLESRNEKLLVETKKLKMCMDELDLAKQELEKYHKNLAIEVNLRAEEEKKCKKGQLELKEMFRLKSEQEREMANVKKENFKLRQEIVNIKSSLKNFEREFESVNEENVKKMKEVLCENQELKVALNEIQENKENLRRKNLECREVPERCPLSIGEDFFKKSLESELNDSKCLEMKDQATCTNEEEFDVMNLIIWLLQEFIFVIKDKLQYFKSSPTDKHDAWAKSSFNMDFFRGTDSFRQQHNTQRSTHFNTNSNSINNTNTSNINNHHHGVEEEGCNESPFTTFEFINNHIKESYEACEKKNVKFKNHSNDRKEGGRKNAGCLVKTMLSRNIKEFNSILQRLNFVEVKFMCLEMLLNEQSPNKSDSGKREEDGVEGGEKELAALKLIQSIKLIEKELDDRGNVAPEKDGGGGNESALKEIVRENIILRKRIQKLQEECKESMLEALRTKDRALEEERKWWETMNKVRRQKERLEEKIIELYRRCDKKLGSGGASSHSNLQNKKLRGFGKRMMDRAKSAFPSKLASFDSDSLTYEKDPNERTNSNSQKHDSIQNIYDWCRADVTNITNSSSLDACNTTNEDNNDLMPKKGKLNNLNNYYYAFSTGASTKYNTSSILSNKKTFNKYYIRDTEILNLSKKSYSPCIETATATSFKHHEVTKDNAVLINYYKI